MNTKTFLLSTILFVTFTNAYAQFNHINYDKKPPEIEIVQIDFTKISTLIFIKLTSVSGSIYIDEKTHLKDTESNKVYAMLNSVNLPVGKSDGSRLHIVDPNEQKYYFCLEFEKLPETINKFNLIEDETNPTAFNFYGISFQKDEKTNFRNIEDFVKATPVKEYGYNQVDSNLIFYYKHKGMSLSMTVVNDKNANGYLQAWINVQNFTGKDISFAPNKICVKSYLEKRGYDLVLKVLSEKKYKNKVKNSQSWESLATTFGNSIASCNASYAYSTNHNIVTGVTNSFVSGAGYVGDVYGYPNSWCTFYSNTLGQQNANTTVAKPYQIKNQISEGYVKPNTIANQSAYMGYFDFKYIKTDNIKMEVQINGETYYFDCGWIED